MNPLDCPSGTAVESKRRRKMEEQIILEWSEKNNLVELWMSIWILSINKLGGSSRPLVWSSAQPALKSKVRLSSVSCIHDHFLLHISFIFSRHIYLSVWHAVTLSCVFLTWNIFHPSFLDLHTQLSIHCPCNSLNLSFIQWCNWMPVITHSIIWSGLTMCQVQESWLGTPYVFYSWKKHVIHIFIPIIY